MVQGIKSYALSAFLLLFVLFSFAEGTKEIRPNAADFGEFRINYSVFRFATYSAADTNDRLYIHINTPGEKIHCGFHKEGASRVWYRIKNPAGVVVDGPHEITNAGVGSIANHAQALIGPFGAGSYTERTYTTLTSGDYYIEFNRDNANNYDNSEFRLDLFDITVTNNAATSIYTGRLWSYRWALDTEGFTNPFNANMYVYTTDSVVTTIDFNGMSPYYFHIACNIFGTENTGDVYSDRKSRNGAQFEPQYKIFLNNPDTIAYPSGTIGEITDSTIVSGCPGGPYDVEVSVSALGKVNVLMNLNGIPGYQAGTEDTLIVQEIVLPGQNNIPWYGHDGFGNLVDPNTSIDVDIEYFFGLTNLPIYDVENHSNGYKIASIRPSVVTPLVYWDDALVGGSTNLLGCPGATGCHDFLPSFFGDGRTLNTWWYVNVDYDNAIYTTPQLSSVEPTTDVACANDSDGMAVSIVTGSYPPYEYRWIDAGGDTISTNDTAFNLYEGTFKLLIRDSLKCDTIQSTVVIDAPDPLDINIHSEVNQTMCTFGSMIASPNGGTPPYTYSWSPIGGTASKAIGLVGDEDTATYYTVTVYDKNGCTQDVEPHEIYKEPDITGSVVETDVLCNGDNTGSAYVVYAGGTGALSGSANLVLSFSGGVQNADTVNGLTAGGYTVTITDDSLCQLVLPITIIEPVALSVTLNSADSATCGEYNGVIRVDVSGGTAPYTYVWSHSATEITNVADSLQPGITYSVTIIDALGCSDSLTGISMGSITAPTVTTTLTPTCPNTSQGTATVTPTGTTGPFTYFWMPTGQTDSTAINLNAGTDSVLVTDTNGCDTTVSVTITSYASQNLVVVSEPTTCGLNNGRAYVTITGATDSSSVSNAFSWNNGQVSDTARNLAVGAYKVVVLDSNACYDSTTINVVATPVPGVTPIKISDVLCYGDTTGSLRATGSGGNTPYTFEWNDAYTTLNDTVLNLPAGTYTIVMSDASGCNDTDSIVVAEPDTIIPNLSVITNYNGQDISCNGASDGAVGSAVTGGDGSYTYSWQAVPAPDSAASGAGNLPAAWYTLTVQDGNGCTVVDSIELIEPTALTTLISDTTYVNCNGDATGEAIVTPTGGVPLYTYSWLPNVGTDSTNSNLIAGQYTVTVEDVNGCQAFDTIIITEPSAIALSIFDSSTICGVDTGLAWVDTSGGTQPFTFVWTDAGGGVVGGNNDTIFNLDEGTYKVVVTDALGCKDSLTTTVDSIPLISASITSINDVSCYNGSDGDITVTAVGGTIPYTYLWDDGVAQTTQIASGLPTRTYSVIVTDAVGCMATASDSIAQPDTILPNVSITSNYNGEDVSCQGTSDGSATAVPTGGVGPYTYSWTSGAATATASGLAAGAYTVTVTDDNSCSVSDVVTLVDAPVFSDTITDTTHILCFGTATGEAIVTPYGGIAPYTFAWLPNGETDSINSNLTAGQYTVTVRDANNCISRDTIVITQNSDILLTTADSATTCGLINGMVSVDTSGGVSPFSILWDASTGGQTNDTATALAAGTYEVIVTDAVGCKDSATAIITATPSPTATVTILKDVTCYGFSNGQIMVEVSGGSLPYTYLWDDPGASTNDTVTGLATRTYSATVTDGSGCTVTVSDSIAQPDTLVPNISSLTNFNGFEVSCFGLSDGIVQAAPTGGTAPYTYSWNTGGTTATQTNLDTGLYILTITDDTGCVVIDSITFTEPPQFTDTLTDTTMILCNGDATGEVIVTPYGGVGPYTYSWLPSGATDSTNSNLIAGQYTVTITDNNGCEQYDTIIITQPTPLVLTTSDTNAFCGANNGEAVASASGGTGAITYQWNDGGSQVTPAATGLTNGTYRVVITDANGCQDSADVIVSRTANLNVTIDEVTNVLCNGDLTGLMIPEVIGGKAPFTYSWSSGSTNDTLLGVGAGRDTVTVTDADGCVRSADSIITQPAVLLINASITSNYNGEHISCFGFSDGIGTAAPTGGRTPYSYLWSGGGIAATKIGLAAGAHTVTVTDNNGCTDDSILTFNNPTPFALISASDTTLLCNGDSAGMIEVDTVPGSGGTGALTYTWIPAAYSGSDSIYDLPAGTYSVIVRDANNCRLYDTAIVSQPAPITFTRSTVNSNCGLPDGQAFVNGIAGGTGPYDTLWTNTIFTDSLIDTLIAGAGAYTVTVRDANSCERSTAVNILDNTAPSVSITFVQNILCNDSASGMIVVDTTGGTQPVSILWNDPSASTNDTLFNVPAGSYSVTITDATPCVASADTTLTEPTFPISAADLTFFNANCADSTDGYAYATGIGGTPWTRSDTLPYKYDWTAGTYSSNSLLWDTVTSLGAGAVTLRVTDSVGCYIDTTFTITEPAALTLTEIHTSIACNGDSTGSIEVTIGGGTFPYSYLWFTDSTAYDTLNGAVTNIIGSRPAGRDSVSVTDANGCVIDTAITLQQNQRLTIGIDSISPEYCDRNDAWIAATVSGGAGAPGYNFSWTHPTYGVVGTNLGLVNTQDSIFSQDSSLVNFYTLTVTDDSGCTADTVFNVNYVGGPTVSITSVVNDSCKNLGTGQIVALGAGGVQKALSPFYDYAWSNAQTTPTASNLVDGNYSVTITDSNNCTATIDTVITEPNFAVIFADISITEPSCGGYNDGYVLATGIGGTPWTRNDSLAYSFSWIGGTRSSNSLLADSAFNVSAGNVTVTLKDSMNCTVDSTVVVGEPSPLTLAATPTNINCYGDSTGSIAVVIGGGTAPYNYLWFTGAPYDTINGEVSNSIVNRPAGKDSVAVTDNQGCIIDTAITLIQNARIAIIDQDSLPEFCDRNDGTIWVEASGGAPNPGYSFVWNHTTNGSPGNNTTRTETRDTIFNLDSSTAILYTLRVRDSLNCRLDTAFDVAFQTGVTIDITSVINDSCKASGTGQLVALADTGLTPYSYLWSNGSNNDTINGLLAGNYLVTVTDANGCTATTDTSVTEPSFFISAANITIQDALCFDSLSGYIVAEGVGGTPYTNSAATLPYMYSWTPVIGGNGTFINTPLTWDSLFDVHADDVTITITDSLGCSYDTMITVGEPTPLTITETHTNINCYGFSTGSIQVTVAGGTFPYTYLWYAGSPYDTINGQTTNFIASRPAGRDSVSATDAQGCVIDTAITLLQNSRIAIVQQDSLPEYCDRQDGEIQVNISGGFPSLAPGYNYRWTHPTYGLLANVTGLSADSNTLSGIDSSITQLYSLRVTDSLACILDTTFDLGFQIGPNVTITSVVNDSCNGDGIGNGQLIALADTGLIPYLYSWNDPSTTLNDTVNNLFAGSYQVTVTDANGCIITTDTIVIQPSFAVTAGSITVIEPLCFDSSDGYVYASGAGGTPYQNSSATLPYFYTWANHIGMDTTLNPLASDTARDISAGSIDLTVSDSLGCSYTTTINISQPTQLTTTLDSILVDCYGQSTGKAIASPANATAPYFYLWSNGQNTKTATGLAVGVVSVRIRDNHGCEINDSTTVTQYTQLFISDTIYKSEVCQFMNGGWDGTIEVAMGGGVPSTSYTYLWTHNVNGVVGNTSKATGLDSSMSEYYYLQVQDDSLCTYRDSLHLDFIPGIAINNFVVDTTLCYDSSAGFGGSAQVVASGPAPISSYLWSSGDITASTDSLHAGVYTVQVTDTSGCVVTGDTTIPDALPITSNMFVIQNASCEGYSDGEARVQVFGGTPVYSYTWLSGTSPNNDTATGLDSNIHVVLIEDANGCRSSDTVQVSDPDSLIISYFPSLDATCDGYNDGEAYSTATGGTLPYTYSWSTGDMGNTLLGADSGSYTAYITDVKGCIDSVQNIPVSDPNPISSVISDTLDIDCFGNNTGEATVTSIGGTMPYTYSWFDAGMNPTGNLGPTDSIRIDLFAGSYHVQVTDVNNCPVGIANFVISEPPQLQASFAAGYGDSVFCGQLTGEALAVVTGGTTTDSNYYFQWLPANNDSAYAGGFGPGTVQVTVIDNHNCSVTIDTVFRNKYTGNFDIISVDNLACKGKPIGKLTVGRDVGDTEGAGGPFSYQWYTGSNASGATLTTSPVLAGIDSGAYSVRVRDIAGCDTIINGSVSAPLYYFDIDVITDTICVGDSNNVATVVLDTAVSGIPTIGSGLDSLAWSLNPGVWGITNTSITGVPALTQFFAYAEDVNDCYDKAFFTVEHHPYVKIDLFEQAPVQCNGENGEVLAVFSDGTAPYHDMLWKRDGVNLNVPDPTPTMVTTDVIVGGVGTYTFQVGDANGCYISESFDLLEPPDLISFTVSLGNSSLDTCSDNPVTYEASADGGTPFEYPVTKLPYYEYAWVNSNGDTLSKDSIVNIPAGSDDTYSIVVRDAVACEDVVDVDINVIESPDMNITVTPGVVCEAGEVTLSATSTDNRTIVRTDWLINGQFFEDEENPTVTFNQSGLYDVLLYVEDITACTNQILASDLININANPDARYLAETQTRAEDISHFRDYSLGYDYTVSWDWKFIDPETMDIIDSFDVKEPSYSFPDTGWYLLNYVVTNNFGCSDTLNDSIYIFYDHIIFIPNTFTPNSDGHNDVFIPKGAFIDYDHSTMRIFDRWGELIYETNNLRTGWDGNYANELVQDGVYTYIIIASDYDGRAETYYGSVNLLK